MKISWLLPVLAIGLAGCAGHDDAAAPAGLVFSAGPFKLDSSFASDSTANQFINQLIAEKFTIGAQDQVASVRWWGKSENSNFPDLRNMESFSITIYQDSGNLPGAALGTTTVSVADTTPTSVAAASDGAPIFRHEANLASKISLAPGTYWISIGTKNTDPDGDGWYWACTETEDDNHFANQLPVGDPWAESGFDDLCFEAERGTL